MTAATWCAALLGGATAVAFVRATGVGPRRGRRTREGPVVSDSADQGRCEPGLAAGRFARHGHDAWRPPGAGPRAGGAAVAVVLLVVALVVLGPAGAAGAAIAAVLARAAILRRRRRRQTRAVDEAMPELIGLFVIAAAAGHPVAACVEAVAVRAPPAVRGALVEVTRRVARGAPLAESLERLGPTLGPLGPSLVDALVGAQRNGSPLAPVLGRVAATARDRRVRAAEEAARRLPVTLLFPLVCCVLPAFALLAVVPLFAGSLDALQR